MPHQPTPQPHPTSSYPAYDAMKVSEGGLEGYKLILTSMHPATLPASCLGPRSQLYLDRLKLIIDLGNLGSLRENDSSRHIIGWGCECML